MDFNNYKQNVGTQLAKCVDECKNQAVQVKRQLSKCISECKIQASQYKTSIQDKRRSQRRSSKYLARPASGQVDMSSNEYDEHEYNDWGSDFSEDEAETTPETVNEDNMSQSSQSQRSSGYSYSGSYDFQNNNNSNEIASNANTNGGVVLNQIRHLEDNKSPSSALPRPPQISPSLLKDIRSLVKPASVEPKPTTPKINPQPPALPNKPQQVPASSTTPNRQTPRPLSSSAHFKYIQETLKTQLVAGSAPRPSDPPPPVPKQPPLPQSKPPQRAQFEDDHDFQCYEEPISGFPINPVQSLHFVNGNDLQGHSHRATYVVPNIQHNIGDTYEAIQHPDDFYDPVQEPPIVPPLPYKYESSTWNGKQPPNYLPPVRPQQNRINPPIIQQTSPILPINDQPLKSLASISTLQSRLAAATLSSPVNSTIPRTGLASKPLPLIPNEEPQLPPRKPTGKTAGEMQSRPLPVTPVATQSVAEIAAQSLQMQPYYFDVDRNQAVAAVLALKTNGAFLVRPSQNGGIKVPYTLTLVESNKPIHLNIRYKGNEYALGKEKDTEKTFPTIMAMIENHKLNPIFVTTNDGPKAKECVLKISPSK